MRLSNVAFEIKARTAHGRFLGKVQVIAVIVYFIQRGDGTFVIKSNYYSTSINVF